MCDLCFFKLLVVLLGNNGDLMLAAELFGNFPYMLLHPTNMRPVESGKKEDVHWATILSNEKF